MPDLPVTEAVPELRTALGAGHAAVLIAEPGAGKTTRVPLLLMDDEWLLGRKIIMLEPRRLAARTAARYMAAALGEQPGETVGYRVRTDTRVSARTRIEVVTEGVLTRMLQTDPALEEVGLVIFDEYHERSLHADLGLALIRQAQQLLRPDLRLLIMSATLAAEPLAAMLGDQEAGPAPIVRSAGRAYPVATRYLQQKSEDAIPAAVAKAVARALAEEREGDLLVFVPGIGEINRVTALLQEINIPGQPLHIVPLHGNLSHDAQDLAVRPSADGRRKVVLATAVAESSITVDGVKIVIDCGWMRVPRFSPRTGMTRLETVPVSRASADQRRGRAGRLGPGICYRLWTTEQHERLPEAGVPEILAADLASLALEVAAWGAGSPAELDWIDPPPEGAYNQAAALLRQLGAFGEDNRLTAHGRKLAEAGMHPRLAHMVLRAQPLALGGKACQLAALLGERDMLRRDGSRAEADLRLRLDALEGIEPRGYTIDHTLKRQIVREAERWRRAFRIKDESDAAVPAEYCGLLVAFAYPDRIGEARSGGRYRLRTGRGAILKEAQLLAKSPYLAVAELEDGSSESQIVLAAPVTLAELEQHFSDDVEKLEVAQWDAEQQAVKTRRQVKLGEIILRDQQIASTDPEAVAAVLANAIRQQGLARLPWTKTARQLQQRIVFMRAFDASFPAVDDAFLLAEIDVWLLTHLFGLRSMQDVGKLSMTAILESLLTWEQRGILEREAPTYIIVPSGSKIPIDYSNAAGPILAVRLQEMFGMAETPRIGNGRIALTLQLLSPAQRPVQVTKDLASFWQTAYFDVKKDLKGRYPKHAWPDDPLIAAPTSRTRPRV
ncbi:ATP-dependent helicase HrpB [Paenibacillaceae bacterium]|nr:ATP-dependent helicase HrpB [Paenibacillaceae bacterium]